jgi:hypothetical protein
LTKKAQFYRSTVQPFNRSRRGRQTDRQTDTIYSSGELGTRFYPFILRAHQNTAVQRLLSTL